MNSTTVQRTRPLKPSQAAARPSDNRRSAAAASRIAVKHYDSIEPAAALWREMEASASCSIHQTYDWCRMWIETHRPEVLVFVGSLDGAPAFILPLEIVRHGPFRVARYIASPFSNINNGLFSDAFRVAVSADETLAFAFLDALRRLRPGADCLFLDKVPLMWRGERHPLAALPAVENQNRSFQVTLHDDFDAVLAQVNAKRRRKKFRKSERLLQEIGGYTHVVARTSEETRLLLDTFFAQKKARFEAHGIPDVFADPQVQAFFHALAAAGRIGDRQPLQLHGIRLKGEHEGVYCAIAGLSLKDGHVLCQFGSIDDSLCRDASPGELLFHLMIEQACADGAAMFDFGIGDQPYKRSWCDVETIQHDFVLPVTVRGRLMAAAMTAAVSAKRFVKQNPTAFRIAQRLRALKTRLGNP